MNGMNFYNIVMATCSNIEDLARYVDSLHAHKTPYKWKEYKGILDQVKYTEMNDEWNKKVLVVSGPHDPVTGESVDPKDTINHEHLVFSLVGFHFDIAGKLLR